MADEGAHHIQSRDTLRAQRLAFRHQSPRCILSVLVQHGVRGNSVRTTPYVDSISLSSRPSPRRCNTAVNCHSRLTEQLQVCREPRGCRRGGLSQV